LETRDAADGKSALRVEAWCFVFGVLPLPVGDDEEAVARRRWKGMLGERKGATMKKSSEKKVEQPKPFTPGVSKAQVRQHAFEMFRDKLPAHPLTLEDWVLAEKDLVASLEADNLPK
jgi:hypothetical protein